MIFETLSPTLALNTKDLCVIGAGPVGLALAMAAARRGLTVLVVEAGPSSGVCTDAAVSEGHKVDLAVHAPMPVTACRGLGGTSQWWGGRCVPFDEIDFRQREDVVAGSWPFDRSEVSPFHDEAAAFFGVQPGEFESVDEDWRLSDSSAVGLERWAPEINMAKRHHDYFAGSQEITIVCNTTVYGMKLNECCNEVEGVAVQGHSLKQVIGCKQLVIACGGLESTRLLLATQAHSRSSSKYAFPPLILGKNYMGHISGKIADIVFNDPKEIEKFDFFMDGNSYARRRLTLNAACILREQLLSTAFWVDNPPFSNPTHRSGVLSLVWLALASPFVGRRLVSEGVRLSHIGVRPRHWGRHVLNIFRSPIQTAFEIARIVKVRFLQKPAMPGFIIRNESGRYALHFHSEQSPDCASSVDLNTHSDPSGLPFLNINLRFRKEDAARIVKAHALLDADLRLHGKARLAFYDEGTAERIARVMQGATDGFHQIGTTRMGSNPDNSVVDGNCQVHGVKNLFVASSSVFPTSGQANPTFMAVTLAIRLAEFISVSKKNNQSAFLK